MTTQLVEDDLTLGVLSRSLRVKSRKKKDLFKLSREGRLNPGPASGGDESGWDFTEEKLQCLPRDELFATGPEDPLEF